MDKPQEQDELSQTINSQELLESPEENPLEVQGPMPAPTDDLPMVVHLKGYEDHFSQFSWDAKKVMEVLGIRRSRLNQISGEELRVGKARIDRYLRPIYRPEDVQKYLEWTKPTASHQRSTTIIDQARLKLDRTSEDLRTSLLGYQEELRDTFKNLLHENGQRQQSNSEALSESLFRKLTQVLEKLEEKIHFSLSALTKKQIGFESLCEGLLEEIKERESKNDFSHEILESLAKGFDESIDKMILMEEEQESLADKLDLLMETLREQTPKKAPPRLSLSERKNLQGFKAQVSLSSNKLPPRSLCLSERRKKTWNS